MDSLAWTARRSRIHLLFPPDRRHECPYVDSDAGANIMTKSSRKKDTQMAAERDPSTTKPGTSSVPQNAVEPKPTKAPRPITDPTTAQQENAVAQQGRTGRLPDRVKRPGANSDTNWQRSVPSGARTARPIQSR